MKKIEQNFYSNFDLSKFSNKRLKIEKIDFDNEKQLSIFQIESSFEMYDCQCKSFCYEFFRNLLGNKGIREMYFWGNASCPWGLSVKQSNH